MRFEFIDPDKVLAGDSFNFVEGFITDTRRWKIGWHYITDLAWILDKAMKWPQGARVLDAGGGAGPTQFLLAEMGFHVTNIDLHLPLPPKRYARRYGAVRKELKSFRPTEYLSHLQTIGAPRGPLGQLKEVGLRLQPFEAARNVLYETRHVRWRSKCNLSGQPIGRVDWIVGNLCDCREVTSETFDAVVSLSALEHVPIDLLPSAVREIRRMMKPDAAWAVTTSATERASGWYHSASRGWCFSEQELQDIFGAKPFEGNLPAIEALKRYRDCGYLKDRLASFYRRSGDNGMPWGIWAPQYVPVGICN
jgi:ubiquinone/menaquinone biosynthesis C-methylase UbiE